MAAWGYGLLQNDDAQDGLCAIHKGIEADIAKLARRRPAEAMAARLAAGVGLLLHLNAQDSFNAENEFFANLNAALGRHEPQLDVLPKRAGTLLRDLREPEKGADLSARTGTLDRQLQSAFFAKAKAADKERRFGRREPALFEHPEAAAYVQKVADRCLRVVSAGFRKRSLTRELAGCRPLDDRAARAAASGRPAPRSSPTPVDNGPPGRQGGPVIAALATLLVIEPCQVNPTQFRDCWDLYRSANIGLRYGDATEFHSAHGACLRTALEAGIRRFTSALSPEEQADLGVLELAPLEE